MQPRGDAAPAPDVVRPAMQEQHDGCVRWPALIVGDVEDTGGCVLHARSAEGDCAAVRGVHFSGAGRAVASSGCFQKHGV